MAKTLVLLVILTVFSLCFPQSLNAQVVINEFSSSTSDDWVEIYNFGETTVDLSSYLLRDSTSTNKKVLSGMLGKNSLLVFDFSNRLNNSEDIVKLIKLTGSEENIVDSISYGSDSQVCAPDGGEESIGRVTNGGNTIDRFKTATKGSSNDLAMLNPCPAPTSEPIATNTPTPMPKPTNTSSPKPTETEIPTSSPKLKPTTSQTDLAENMENGESQVLGLIGKGDINPTLFSNSNNDNQNESQQKIPVITIALIISGLGTILFAISLIVRRKI